MAVSFNCISNKILHRNQFRRECFPVLYPVERIGSEGSFNICYLIASIEFGIFFFSMSYAIILCY
jgi:hypothetical protein